MIREFGKPIREHAGIAVVRGNLAPLGAVIKPSAATPRLLQHRGRAVVFEDIEDFKARIDRPDLAVDENSVMVLKGCGPKGYPGMPEVGNMPLPPKLLAARHHRCGAHLRRPHERNGVRDRGAARGSRIGRGGSSGAGAGGR